MGMRPMNSQGISGFQIFAIASLIVSALLALATLCITLLLDSIWSLLIVADDLIGDGHATAEDAPLYLSIRWYLVAFFFVAVIDCIADVLILCRLRSGRYIAMCTQTIFLGLSCAATIVAILDLLHGRLIIDVQDFRHWLLLIPPALVLFAGWGLAQMIFGDGKRYFQSH